jgi:16S rRNA (guanine(966)-N(2))-methyltransferase RsmD
MRLLSPKDEISRPIIDRVKESLFSVLYKYDVPEGKVIADLFSGVGSLGLESLSRGAEFVTFVDKDPKICAILKKNVEKAGFVKESKIIRANAFRIGAPVEFGSAKYDVVFVDPPFKLTRDCGDDSLLSGLFALLANQVKAEGIVAVRTNKSAELLDEYGVFRTAEQRRWGINVVTIFRLARDDE